MIINNTINTTKLTRGLGFGFMILCDRVHALEFILDASLILVVLGNLMLVSVFVCVYHVSNQIKTCLKLCT